MNKILFLVCVALTIFSCTEVNHKNSEAVEKEEHTTIEGLWIVESVWVGEEEMTPNARWTRFNADHTQESGNGRFQHSYGTWKLSPGADQLSIQNSNGLEDEFEPFSVSIDKNEMTWERNEEGQSIKVNLVRTSSLPETYGDRILGLWELESARGKGQYFEQADPNKTKNYLFFRWDKRFVIGTETGRKRGVYQVHGHRPEVEFIPNEERMDRISWEIQFEENRIIMWV